MFEFFSLAQIQMPSFVIKVLTQFTISQFDAVPYVEFIDKKTNARDGDEAF
jgi:hypothetical protein